MVTRVLCPPREHVQSRGEVATHARLLLFLPGLKLDHERRGFTLVELMAVVGIVGVLAVIALVSYAQYINAARSSEAVWMISSIRSAQESYKAETLVYLNVSTTLDSYYPMDTPSNTKYPWGGGNSDIANKWRVLNVSTDGPVMFGYATIAGLPGVVETSGLAVTSELPDATEPWYIVQAKGDVDGDGKFSYCIGTSFSNELIWVNKGE